LRSWSRPQLSSTSPEWQWRRRRRSRLWWLGTGDGDRWRTGWSNFEAPRRTEHRATAR